MKNLLCVLSWISLALGFRTGALTDKATKEVIVSKGVREPRIVGGYEVNPPFMYPFLVSLQRFKNHFCGGTIYDENTIITAAHCTVGELTFGFEAVIHRHNLTMNDTAENGIRRRVVKRVIHPEFSETTIQNDIAIWKLEPPKTYHQYFTKSITLDDGSIDRKNGDLIHVAGWGLTKSQGAVSDLLLEVKLPISDTGNCNKTYSAIGLQVNPQIQMCAGYPEGGKDTCQGDSGGPFFVQEEGKFVMVGVVSWGLGCASPNIPGVYTRIQGYLPWIKDTIKSL